MSAGFDHTAWGFALALFIVVGLVGLGWVGLAEPASGRQDGRARVMLAYVVLGIVGLGVWLLAGS